MQGTTTVATAKKTVAAKAAVPRAAVRKAAPKPAAKAAPVAAKPAPAPKPAKAEKPKKPKLVRDSFTIPKAEYTVLDDLKQRAAKLGAPAKKSEVLRAGIKALAQMSDVAFQSAMAA
eukprot:gene8560-10899_t